MADSTEAPLCAVCDEPLEKREIDFDLRVCHECRSPTGKISELDIAIRASGDSPERIAKWPAIRHRLRNRFGQDRSDMELWERCTDWLQAEGKLSENDYLILPLNVLIWILEQGFEPGFQDQLENFRQQHHADQLAKKAKRREVEDPTFSASETPLEDETQGPEQASDGESAPTEDESSDKPDPKSGFTLIDRFPETPAGHLAFLEFVRDEIHFAAEAKLNQFAEKYSNETIANMVRGRDLLMQEATSRIKSFSEPWPKIVEDITRVLRRKLTSGTVERIDDLLTPAVRALRDAWEERETAVASPNGVDVISKRFAKDDAASRGKETNLAASKRDDDKRTNPIAKSKSDSVLLFERHEGPIVNGNEKKPLTQAQYNVVQTLLEAGKGLSKDILDSKSGHPDARKILKRLAKDDADWKAVISFPGKARTGYHIV